MANNLNFNQMATLLSTITAQATGKTAITPTNTSEFVSVANTALLSGYDNLIGAISQVLSKTIFSVRPYSRKFAGLHADSIRYGNHVRKIQIVDSDAQNDDRQNIENGKSVDQQAVNKPEVLQTNFYGASVYQRCVTLFKDQLDVAFSGPEEFARFVTMVVQNVSDLIEKDHEECARATLANFIGGKVLGDSSNVIHLLTEFNNANATTLTAEELASSGFYPVFMKFVMARIKTISDFMSERSVKYHININGKPIARHTPKEKQKIYLSSGYMNLMETSTLSSVFHDEYLKKVDYESVNFWQSIDTPNSISCKPVYIGKASGALITATENTVVDNIFGVIFDEEALGYTVVNAWSASAPFNARGGYSNTFWHFTDRYWNDFTENGVVLLLD